MNEELSSKNVEKHKNFEGIESTMPAQKVAYTMPETKISFCSFSSLSAGIQAIACCRRGSGGGNNCLEMLFSSYLTVAKNAKITPNLKYVFLNY